MTVLKYVAVGLVGAVAAGVIFSGVAISQAAAPVIQVDGAGNTSISGKAEIAKGLTVGRSAAPKGITLYDQASGNPACVTVKALALYVTAGACN